MEDKNMKEPIVGSIVWYRRLEDDKDPYPAIVTFADGYRVMLQVFYHNSIMPHVQAGAANSFAEAKAGEWCWPEGEL
jgi:hypothetical protein